MFEIKNTSITIKVLVFTLIIGIVVWSILDYTQSKSIQQVLIAELKADLETHAKEGRAVFDHYIQTHNQATKIIISQQRFQTYVNNDNWLDNEEIKHHYRLPPWLPKASVMRAFFNARYAILLDSEKKVREVYYQLPQELPQVLQKTGTLLQRLSHNQSYMTNIDDFPYVLSLRNFKDKNRKLVATVMLASPIDDDFLINAIGNMQKDIVVTLVNSESGKIISSGNPDLLASNVLVADLQQEYIKTGASFFDYGASDVNAQFASFMQKEKAYSLATNILDISKKQRAFFAAALIVLFVLLTVWITQRIRQVTKQVIVFSRDSLGLEIHSHGDEISQIVHSFQQLRNSIKETIGRATAIAAGNYSYVVKNYSEQDELGRALTDMNNTLQHQTKELQLTNDKLQSLNEELELRVADRTAQLAKANEEITNFNKSLKSENLRLGAELNVARRMQTMVLPSNQELNNVAGLDIAGYMDPADEVGGDYYDVLQDMDRVKIGIGDVTGHGLESGVLMLMVQTAIRTLLASDISHPQTFLNILNQVIYKNVQRMNSDKNLTLSLLDYSQGTLQLTGQHEEVLLVRKDGNIERIDTFDLGFMVGLEPDISPFLAQKTIFLESGDGVVLFTDGITEARNPYKKMYGLDRLCKTVSYNWNKSATDVQKAVIDDVYKYISTQKLDDDITLLVLKQE